MVVPKMMTGDEFSCRCGSGAQACKTTKFLTKDLPCKPCMDTLPGHIGVCVASPRRQTRGWTRSDDGALDVQLQGHREKQADLLHQGVCASWLHGILEASLHEHFASWVLGSRVETRCRLVFSFQ